MYFQGNLRRIRHHPLPSDAESGIAGYAYPALGTGWSRSAGSYSFTGSAGTATGSVTATNGAGSIAATTLTARSDVDGPTGGALTVNGVLSARVVRRATSQPGRR